MIAEYRRGAPLLLSSLAASLALLTSFSSLLDLDVYRPTTPHALLPGAASQDLVTVVASLGILGCVLATRRGHDKLWLVWTGLLAYLTYGYALYAFERVYNGFFLTYVAILGLSVYGLGSFFARADLSAVSASSVRPPPRRSTAGLLIVLLLLFVTLWLSVLIPAMASRTPPPGSAIFVLDLAFFLPLVGLEALLLLRTSHLGDVLAVPILVKLVTLGTSVLTGTLLVPLFGGTLVLSEVATYTLLGVAPLGFLVLFWRRITVDGSRAP
jgi:protein-S-isoprenylcysteine O-methyltransferase Ste14